MIIDETTLKEAALQLLASNTLRRYVREAGRLAVQSGLVAEIRQGSARFSEVQARLIELLHHLDPERSLEEFEAAIALCAFARSNFVEESSALLQRAACVQSPWVRSLALRLLQLGPPSQEELSDIETQLRPYLSASVSLSGPMLATDRGDPDQFPRAA